MKVAVDFDGVLVDASGEWLPGSLEMLRWLLGRGDTVIVHSCRANWLEGLQSIKDALLAVGVMSAQIWTKPGKPDADLYVDDKAVHFAGDWQPIRALIEHAVPPSPTVPKLATRAGRRPPARTMWH